MRNGLGRLVWSTLVLLSIVGFPSSSAYAQGGTTSTLSGVVVDTAGGVVPGADVAVKHSATGVTLNQATNSEGVFSFPGLNPGKYIVTVTLQGFKTNVINDVVLTAGAPASVRAVLEVGGIEEQVVVSSTSEVVQTQSPTVSTTVTTNQIIKTPLTSRSAMDFVNLLPGVSSPGGNRDATINGLPRGMINITMDGVNIQDNTLRSTDGFFSIVSPRLDAVDEVTVTTASQGADSSGQGAVQIKFVTRSGTNTFTGSGYEYYRADKLNANTWFNNRNGVAKPKLLSNQYGFRTGGPIVIPGLFDGHNKAFFFWNYEQTSSPSDTTRNRTILNPGAQIGNFTYGSTTINVLDLAARNGFLSTADATVAKLLADIRTATTKTGSIQPIDSNLDRYSFNVSVQSKRWYPTGRVDYNITGNHRISSAFNYNNFTDFPDTLNNFDASFPDFPVEAGQSSKRLGFSNWMRSTLSSSLVNEARVGYSWAPVLFFPELNAGMFTGSTANTQGFHLTLGNLTTANATALTNAGPAPSPQSRNATATAIEDTITWLKGSHNVTMGGSFTQYSIWAKNSSLVPRLSFDLISTDPATTLFTQTNFPGASGTNLTAASHLYALLIGRVAGVTGDARLNESTGEYEYEGTGIQRGRMREVGFYAQDAWRLRPGFTINAGVRYDVQYPFYSLNDSYSTATTADVCGISGTNPSTVCNIFNPQASGGQRPTFQQFKKGVHAYNIDYNNVAPNVGFAWTPGGKSGVLGWLFGSEGDSAIRGGFSRSFTRGGLNDFTGVYNANPGVSISVNRNEGLGNIGTTLLRDPSSLGAASFGKTPSYPMTDVVTQDVSIIDPNIRVPYGDSWQVGFQRSLGRATALEVRYVGTRARDTWQQLNYNEVDIFDNGFVNEFRNAQANLAANIAAGRPASFAYTGVPGTSPLPILLGYLNGIAAARASDPTAYTGTNWTNATLQAFLAVRNPNPFGLAGSVANNGTGLIGNAQFRQNAINAGIPANYFNVNPDLLGGANITSNVGRSKYNSLQLELRRRLTNGLQVSGSYVLARGYVSQFETLRRPVFMLRDAGTPGDLSHSFKAITVYDLPIGRGQHWGNGMNGVLDRIVGGWQVSMTSNFHSGRLVDLGNVRLVGMSEKDVANLFKLRVDNANKKVYMLPQDVIDNTIRAFSVSATDPTGYANGAAPTGRYFAPANGPDCIEVDNGADYGECAARSLVFPGPIFFQTDLRFAKRTRIVGNTNFEFALEMLNALNQHNFTPVGGIGNAIGGYEVTALGGTDTSRRMQLVFRVNW